jgi:hemoglobin-like flavoprotein
LKSVCSKLQWNEELKQAWAVAYGTLSNAMIEAQQTAMEKRA